MDTTANLEVGYGVARGEKSYSVGAAAARQALRSLKENPISVVLVFASGRDDLGELLQGIRSETGEAPLLGATTAGEICPEMQQGTVAVVALASPYLRVRVGVGREASKDWQQALIEAITGPEVAPFFSPPDNAVWSALARQGQSAFGLLFSPAPTRTADSPGFEILETLKRLSQGRLPILGTGAAEDRLAGSSVLWGSSDFPDGILVAVFETGLKFGLSLAPGFQPTKKRAQVLPARGREVLELDGRPRTQGSRLSLRRSFREALGTAGAAALRQALQRGVIGDPAAVLVFPGDPRRAGLEALPEAEISGLLGLTSQIPVLGLCGFSAHGLAPDLVQRHDDELIAVLALSRELSGSAELALENKRLRQEVDRLEVNRLLAVQRLKRENARRQKIQLELEKSEDLFHSFMEHLPGMVAILDPQGHHLYVNETWERVAQKTRGEALGKTVEDIWPPDMAARHREADLLALTSHQSQQTIFQDTRINSVHNWLLKRFPVLDQAGVPRRLGMVGIDITDLKQAEEAFKSLVYNAPIGIFIIQEGKFRLVNPGFLRLTGYTEADLLGIDSLRYVADGYKETVRSQVIQMLKGEKNTPYEFQIVTKGGEARWVMETVTPIQYEGKRAALGFFMDIDELASLKNQFLQAQKMEAVGRLAGGVAHDFNNILTAIMGYCEIVMMSFRDNDPIVHHLEGIRKSADRAANLTRQLLAFSRKQTLQLRVINLNTVVADLEKMLQRLIGEDINLVIDLDPALKMVKADPGQIEQVLMNLVINARDAMPQGGKLLIRTANVYLDEVFTQHRVDLIPGPYIRVSVIDQGLGMAPETLSHIFEPFFTTKDVSKGTGLGLSMVYGVVKQSGGHIEVASKTGGGTVFDLYFRQLGNAVEEPRSRTATAALPQGTETVLVVEDEDILLNLIKDALEMYGYQVHTAHDGIEAEEFCRRHPAPIHLMLTDVVMPHKNGRELAELLTLLHPEMKILYMSGYSEDALAMRGLVEAAMPFLQKPFPPLDLVRKVREMLDA